MHLSNAFKWAVSFLAATPAVNAAFVTLDPANRARLAVVIGTKLSYQALNSLWDVGVRNIPIALAGAVNDELQNRFGWGPFGGGLQIAVKYTDKALQSGAQGYFVVIWEFWTESEAAAALEQVRDYVVSNYKRDEVSAAADFVAISNLTVVDPNTLPVDIFNTTIADGNASAIAKRGLPNTVCHNPTGFSFTLNAFNKVNPVGQNFNQCESCYGGSRNGC